MTPAPRHERPVPSIRVRWARLVGWVLLLAALTGEVLLLLLDRNPGLIDGRDGACVVAAIVGLVLVDTGSGKVR